MSLRIGIVSAMEREVAPLIKTWAHETITHDGRSFSTWKSGSVTYIQSGIGRDPAIHATRGLLASERPDIIITAGFAGALIRILSVGDLITPGTVIDGQTGERFEFAFGTGVLVSSTSIVDEAGKKKLATKHAAEAVDMEGASVARVAAELGIPCFALKAISDELSFAMPPFNAYVKENGALAVERFAAHVFMRPGYWPSLVQLARNSKKASLELSGALQHLLSNSDNEQQIVQGMRELADSARMAN